jgi:putative transposase
MTLNLLFVSIVTFYCRQYKILDSLSSISPERFVKGRPIIKMPPSEIAINPISAEDIAEGVVDAVNFPTLYAAGYQENAI